MTKIEIIFNGERIYGLSEVLAYLDKQRECISELEKENAELKEKVGKYQIGMFDEIEKRDRRLTKAIEFLEWALHPEHDDDFDTKWKAAEQFLKEVET